MDCRPAEHINSSVEEGNKQQYYSCAKPFVALLDVFRERRVATPELHPRKKEKDEEVKGQHCEDPLLQSSAEKHQHGDSGGNFQGPPEDDANVSDWSQPDLVVIILDLDGEDVTNQGSVRD